MATLNFSPAVTTATWLALCVSGVPAVGLAQTPTPPPTKPHEQHQGMKGMSGMSAIMAEPHHALVMAYRDNVVTFGRALQDRLTPGKAVNLELARPAVGEMRRGFEQMRNHQQAHLATMGAPADSTMLAMKQRMETHLVATGEHLSALETALAAAVPNPVRVKEHTTAILKECAAMSATSDEPGKSSMPPTPKPRPSP